MSELKVYKASAGSGKTFRLVAEYLKLLIQNPNAYRETLAVTFTNKATAEMKERIINHLYKIKTGQKDELLESLVEETGKDKEFIKKQAETALSKILHDYSMFSISTIDSFVQRIIQNLLWELGEHGNNDLVIEHVPYIEKATDSLLDELTKQSELFEHFAKLIEQKLNDNKSPNIQKDIIELGKMLFNERYRLLSTDEKKRLHDKSTLNELRNETKRLIDEIYDKVKKGAIEIISIILNSGINGLNSDNFQNYFKKSKGVLPTLVKLSELKPFQRIELKSADENATSDISAWLKKEQLKQMQGFVEQQLMPAYREFYNYLSSSYKLYNTALAINDNLPTLMIINELYLKFREILKDDGVMLLSDGNSLLNEFVNQSDTPFVYEKIGTRYMNYMIDEFQDTSQMQWKNFEPLITDSIGSNGLSMVVGDMKQSIYRWRNGDWRIMADIEANPQLYNREIISLSKNYRSTKTVVYFNNAFFKNVVAKYKPDSSDIDLDALYRDVEQVVDDEKKQGCVEVAFLPPRTDSPNDAFTTYIKDLLIDLKLRGYNPGDIAFLVRKNAQGREMADLLLRLKESEKELSNFIEIVSDDVLTLNASAAVRLCIAALKIALNPNDSLAIAQFQKEQALLFDSIIQVSDMNNWADVFFDENFDSFDWLSSIRFYPLGNMIEAIIEKYLAVDEKIIKGHLPYLTLLHENAINFSYRGTSSLSRFIEWYDQTGKNQKLTMAQSNNAINILTIHKSKGLGFPIIIFPYADLLEQRDPPDDIRWFKPDSTSNEILDNFPLFPILPKKELLNTYFEKEHNEEKFNKTIDKINLQYVAFTRAKNELYIIVTDDKLKNSENELDNVLSQNKFASTLPNQTGINREVKNIENGRIYLYGKKDDKHSEKSQIQDENKEVIASYPINAIKSKIAPQFQVDSIESNTESDLQHGIAMHAILSKIITLNDIDNAVDWAIQNGYLDTNQKQEVVGSLKSILNESPYKEWFSDKWEVKTEASIINTDGSVYRPDRVLINSKQAVIIDFKFGFPASKHKKQVQLYKKLLTDMGYDDVKGYLWYFQLNRHEQI
ncbi:MAG: hypothetical protein PWR03_1647 [Tenuifilum sp.]|jgi:ATP-dependent exoDNAse (exonuclease V) beta subunit|uniref:UvrD-helicase domain-containing protein n=1 Tax=Tenuifilum sp. TaxID=2760880 RepID=UPI0024AB8B06|nr:UvrD-helicase domain-containing protein [Tenuifilum sp.]MDI3527464.1 hypothetical protein [Tenuifilum sp.]